MALTVQRTERPHGRAEGGHELGRLAGLAARSAKNPPRPAGTSSAIAPAPPAIFLLMIEAAISPAPGTVPVASRSA